MDSMRKKREKRHRCEFIHQVKQLSAAIKSTVAIVIGGMMKNV